MASYATYGFYYKQLEYPFYSMTKYISAASLKDAVNLMPTTQQIEDKGTIRLYVLQNVNIDD